MQAIPSHPRILFIVVLVILASVDAISQVNVDPKRVMLSSAQRSSEVLVSNSGDLPVEIDAGPVFAIIRADSLGQTYFDSTGSAAEMARSCHSWARVFPKHFTLPPHENRTIRVLISPPAGLSDGEYRARLIVSNIAVEPSATPVADDSSDAIKAHVRLALHMSLPLIFRKGKVETGIEIASVRMRHLDSATTGVISDLHLLGNAAYRGTLYAVLRRSSGGVADSVSEQYTAEMSMPQRLRLRRVSDGEYRLEVRSVALFRGDAMESVLPAPPVTRSYDVTVSGGVFAMRPLEQN